jgi:hypothetical protein
MLKKCARAAGKLRKNCEELDAGEQGGRYRKTRCLGKRARAEKSKTVALDM